MMRILAVGGSSFIAAHTLARLLSAGHEVTVFDIEVGDNAIHDVLTAKELGRIRLVQGDVLDGLAIVRAAAECRAEAIAHFAAALIPLCRSDPALGVRINCDGLNNSFEAARILRLRRVVWASSIAVYGRQRAYVEAAPDETAPHLPATVYGASKSLNEHLGRHYSEAFGLDNIGLRFTNVYGAARRRGGWSFSLVRELIQNPARSLPGKVADADTPVNWQYVEDAAQAVHLALEFAGSKHSLVYNCGGEVRTVREAAAIVRELSPGAKIDCLPGDNGEIARLDTSRIERELGYRYRFSLRDGLKHSLEAYRRS